MPIYEYLCTACGRRTEAMQRFDEPPLTVCADCGGALRKLLSAPAFQFKGSGWYVTDYARGGKASGDPAKPESSGAAGGGEGSASGGDTAEKPAQASSSAAPAKGND
jgi:putative FmdB family regulatory protein